MPTREHSDEGGRSPPYTVEDCVEAVKEAGDLLGEEPSRRQYQLLDIEPVVGTIYRICGWTEAKRKAGFDPDEKYTSAEALAETYSERDLLDAIEIAASRVGQPPTRKEYEQVRSESGLRLPSSRWINVRLGWRDAVQEAGFEPRSPGDTSQYEYRELIEGLEIAYELNGGTWPSSHRYAELYEIHPRLEPSASKILDEFEDWEAAIEAAGGEYETEQGRNETYSDDAILNAIREANELTDGDTLSVSQYQGLDDEQFDTVSRKPSKSTVYDHFDSWSAAKERAGISV